MSSRKILVPTDFTKVAETAVKHAITTAEIIGGSITLLHVVAKESHVEEANMKLEHELSWIRERNSDIPLDFVVTVGSIFEAIGDTADEHDIELIIMGTHGLRGMQFITGSHALKVVTNSSAPFIIVQEKEPKPEGFKHIIVPLDLSKETKQKLNIAANMAKYFGSRLHLITPNETDEFLKNQLTRNMSYAKAFLAEHGIEFDASIGQTKSGGFVKDLLRFADEVDADLITILNLHDNSLRGMIGSSYEQQLITNEKQIPVMMINPLGKTHLWYG